MWYTYSIMTDKEQIDLLKNEIFKLQLAMKAVSGIAAAGASWQEGSSFDKRTFKKIECQLDEAVEQVKTHS